MRRRFDTPHGEVPRPGQGTVFEHVFDATLGNDTSDPYDRWFWFENPQLGLHQWMYPKRARSPVYDLDGNLVFDDYLFFEYDAENRPIRVVRWGVDQYEFAYDYMGRRVETRYSTGVFEHAQEQWTRRYVYDSWQIIMSNHLTRALDPFFASLQDMVSSGHMSDREMEVILINRKIKQEWAANNKP